MTILDLIKKSAIMLNITKVLEDKNLEDLNYSDEESALSKNDTLKKMYEFSKIVLNEISSYLPNRRQFKYKSKNKEIEFSDLYYCSRVIGVKNKYGYVNYEFSGSKIKVEEDGDYIIIYDRLPFTDSLLDTIDMKMGQVGEDVFVHGLNSYYCLSMGLFAEFNVYHAHYAERLSRLKNVKVFAMPCRSWHD